MSKNKNYDKWVTENREKRRISSRRYEEKRKEIRRLNKIERENNKYF